MPSLIQLSLLLQETGEIAETIQGVLMVRPKLGFEAIRCSPVQRLSLRGHWGGQMHGAMGTPRLLFSYLVEGQNDRSCARLTGHVAWNLQRPVCICF